MFPRDARVLQHTHMIISMDAEKASDKIQHQFMAKMLEKVGTEETDLNIKKATCKKPTAKRILNAEMRKAPHLRLGTR